MHKLSGIAALLLLGLSQGALAQATAQPRFYAGFGVGGVVNNFRAGDIPIAGSTSTLSKDRYDSQVNVYAGYQYTPAIAFEAGFAGAGPTGATRNATAPGAGSLKYSNKTNAWMFSVVGSMSLAEKWQLSGRLGTAYTDTKGTITATGIAPVPVNPNPEATEWNWLVGAGINYSITPTMGLRGEYTRIANVGDSRTTEHALGLWSVGLKFRF